MARTSSAGFLKDWGFWGLVLALATFLFGIYVFDDQRTFALSEYEAKVYGDVQAMTTADVVAHLRRLLERERHIGRKAILHNILRKYESQLADEAAFEELRQLVLAETRANEHERLAKLQEERERQLKAGREYLERKAFERAPK